MDGTPNLPMAEQLTVLVADDDPDILDLVVFRLERSGCKVYTARDGAEALEIMRAHKMNVVILDWMMPVASGVEVIEQMRSDAELASVPVLLLTARAQEADVLSGFEAGADDFLTKPFSPRELSHRVLALSNRRS